MSLLAVALGVVYAPVFAELVRDWGRDPNYSHGYLIPPIAAYLIWKNRGELLRTPRAPWGPGVAGIVLAGAMLVLGTAGAEVFTQRVSVLVLAAAVVVFLAGWRWLARLAFPLAFLLLAIPLPYVVYFGLTQPLQGIAARFAVLGMHGVGILAVGEGNMIHLPGTSLEVAEACSGIRSLYAFLALGALFARSLPVGPWAKGAVFLLTIPLSVLGNSVRVWGTGVGVHVVGPQMAVGWVHEFFGLIVFAVSLVVLVVAGKGVRAVWSSAR